MTDLNDKEFLAMAAVDGENFISEYFDADLKAKFPNEHIDRVLFRYLSYLGKTGIYSNYCMMHVDHVDTRAFRALLGGANPAYRYYAITKQIEDQLSEFIHQLREQKKVKCYLYRMTVKEAIDNLMLEPVDLLITTNIYDGIAASDDILQIASRSNGKIVRLICHGDAVEIDRMFGLLQNNGAVVSWEHTYPGIICESLKIAGITVQIPAGNEILGRKNLETNTTTLRFRELEAVEPDHLLATPNAYTRLLPAGHFSADFALSDTPKYRYDEFRCANLRGARLAGHSLVLNKGGRLLFDSLCAQKSLLEEGRFWEQPYCSPRKEGGYWLALPPVEQYCYEPAMLISYAWEENYQHWLLEVLPQAIAAKKLKVRKIIVSSDIRGYQKRALHLLGFADNDIIVHDVTKTMYCDHLILGSFTAFNMAWINPGAFSVFDELIGATKESAKIEPPEYVYISRSDAEWKRRLLNEDILIQRLHELGFVSINPGTLSFEDEVQFLSKAKIIVAPIGAGLANIAFGTSGAKILAIQSPSFGMNSPFFKMIAGIRGMQYESINAVALTPEFNNKKVGEDDNLNIIVDINAVLEKVRIAMSN